MMNEVYSSAHMVNGGHTWEKQTPGSLARVSHRVFGDPHCRSLMEKTIDQCAAMIRLRTTHVKVIIGASCTLYNLGDYYDTLCANAIRRFQRHGIHCISGMSTFDDIEHSGIHMKKSSENQHLFADRMIEHIADCRPLGDLQEGVPLIECMV